MVEGVLGQVLVTLQCLQPVVLRRTSIQAYAQGRSQQLALTDKLEAGKEAFCIDRSFIGFCLQTVAAVLLLLKKRLSGWECPLDRLGQLKLVPSHNVACLCPTGITLEKTLKQEIGLTASHQCLRFRRCKCLEPEIPSGSCFKNRKVDLSFQSIGFRLAEKLVAQAKVLRGGEIQFTDKSELPAAGVVAFDMNRLLHLQAFGHGGFAGTIGKHQAIEAEVVIGGLITEIPSIPPSSSPFLIGGRISSGPDRPPLLIDQDSLVDPIPDEASLNAARRADGFPVIGKASVGVAHRMAVLAHDQGPVVVTALRVVVPSLDERNGRIHRRDDISGKASTFETLQGVGSLAPFGTIGSFVVNGTGGVVPPQPAGTGVLVVTVPGLIAQRPDNDRGVVVVTPDHPLHPFEETGGPHFITADTVVICVGLYIGLVHDIQAVAVAQLVPDAVVGIMAGAHGIEVVLLHQPDILHHALDRQRLGHILVVLVTVHTLDQHALAVDQKLSFGNLHPPQADWKSPVLIIKREADIIQCRLLAAPKQGLVDREGGDTPPACRLDLSAVHEISLRVVKADDYRLVL
ncbi:hypothetical protein SDC9_56164 [bioreactor metagenome]|uniref:Uncharacterized protein n=1 Tax=bioreactor metagenome TaxID=1076179 RepID=A0A644X1T2_9ZZZZ